MRIVIATHAQLLPELGAAQIALNLAAALRQSGDDVTIWTPPPARHPRPWTWRAHRRDFAAFVRTEGPFDIIDAPPNLLPARLGNAATIARSVQPELRYLALDLSASLRRRTLRGVASLPMALYRVAAALGGWRRSSRILCLGSLELRWMQERFPMWRHKLSHYVLAPEESVRRRLQQVREARSSDETRYLWIGRWAPHKGIFPLVTFIRSLLSIPDSSSITIAGCGSDAFSHPALARLANDRVRILPEFHRDELPQLLAAHDRGLFTSLVEGWGLSLNEMLESGMAVFATKAGAVVDLEPYWPQQLLSFPPTPPSRPPPASKTQLARYERDFRWSRIASAYRALAAQAVGGRA